MDQKIITVVSLNIYIHIYLSVETEERVRMRACVHTRKRQNKANVVRYG